MSNDQVSFRREDEYAGPAVHVVTNIWAAIVYQRLRRVESSIKEEKSKNSYGDYFEVKEEPQCVWVQIEREFWKLRIF